ncbi:ATP-binding protein [Aquabacterium sp.]|uniref:ATP-binding protein n=1 Tax=Aquabacterium sp. TaxID=1872578 RepID=UPI0035B3C6CB
MASRSPAVLKRFYPALVWAVGGVLILVTAFIGFMLMQSRERYHANAEETTRNLALATESFLHAHFEEVELALKQADKEFRREHDSGQFSRERFSDYLIGLKERIPNARAIRGADQDGWVIFGEDIDLTHKQSLKIREFFDRARKEHALIFGVPVRSRITGEWVFPIVYPLTLSNGQFGGVAYVLINNERITDVFRSYNLGQNGVVTLFDSQRRVLLRYPEQPGGPRDDTQHPPTLNSQYTVDALSAGKTSASYRTFSSIDGLHRMLSFQKIGQYPIYVILGVDSDEYLAGWDKEVLVASLFLMVLYGSTLSLLMIVRQTWRQQAHTVAELTESDSRMRLLTEGLPQMVWMADNHGRLSMVSHHWAEFTGIPASSLMATGHWLQAVHPEDQQVVRSTWQQAVEERREWRQICRLRQHDGSWRVFDHQALPQRDHAGQPLCWVGSSTDITATQEAHDALLSAKEQALQAGQAKSAFLANMSHEIRTPMNAIIGMLQLLRQTELTTRQGDYVDKSQSAAKALLSILNDILDYSKVEAGKLTLDPHRFSLDRLLRDVGVILSANLGAKDIEVLYRVEPGTPMWLEGDALRLQQVLLNLAGNAIKFTESGEVELSITPLHRRGNRVSLRFTVRDTGIGIDAAQRQRIFEGFSQAEASTSRRFGGTGLGLAISQRLVRMMGGELQLDSEPGQGSRFWFTIELPEADSNQQNRIRPQPATKGSRMSSVRSPWVTPMTSSLSMAACLIAMAGRPPSASAICRPNSAHP